MKVICSYCNEIFEKTNGQANRAIREGRRMFCSVQHQRLGMSLDLVGKSFGRLTVIEMIDPEKGEIKNFKKNRTYWKCKCECEKERIVQGNYLVKGYSKSCGCHTKERSYGQTKQIEYASWRSMINRCLDPKNEKYPDYGARGISVCDRWLEKNNGFKNFFVDMGSRPNKNRTLDRIDNDGNYEPSNCRWATKRVQSRNKRNNVWYDHSGRKKVLKDWAKYFKVNSSSLYEMLQRGKTFNEVYDYYITEKPKKLIKYKGMKMNLSGWARFFGVCGSTLSERIRKGQTMNYIFKFYEIKNAKIQQYN